MFRDNFSYGSISEANIIASSAFDRPKKITVTEAAKKSLFVREMGGSNGYYSPELTPYMKRPCDLLASRIHESVCFVGPARSGKTVSMIGGLLAYSVTSDPGHFLIVQMTKEMSEKFSKQTVTPWIIYSPEISKFLGKKSSDDNVSMKIFTNGMALTIAHPAPSSLASIGYRYVALTDFDRYVENQEGNVFSQARKRVQNYLSRGMTLVESSPGRDLTDVIWTPTTKHEAPPVEGILSIYNMSSRERWYWPCLHCGNYFEVAPDISIFSTLPEYDELTEIVKAEKNLKTFSSHHAKVVCRDCGGIHNEKDKKHLNSKGVWLGEDQWFEDGIVYGEETQSTIAGFWLSGAATPFQEWKSILYNYLAGLKTYLHSGSEESLKTATNVDFGAPYIPRSIYESRGGNDLKNRKEDYDRYYVPDWTRVLLASVDVQGGRNGRFVVQVHAVGEYMRQCVVDRFDIAYTDEDQTKRRVNPGAMAQDWDLLMPKVIKASYKTHDDRKMLVYMVAIDTGGEGDTTNQAYQFYRRLRAANLASKVMLIKGRSNKVSDPVIQSFGADDRGNKLRDVPIYLVDTSYFKDIIASMLRKLDSTGIYLHLPKWVSGEFIEELQAEIKDEKGKWVPIRQRNESLDLCVYILALCWKLGLNKEGFKWDAPPHWCHPLESNNHVVSVDFARQERNAEPAKKSVTPSRQIFSSEWAKRL